MCVTVSFVRLHFYAQARRIWLTSRSKFVRPEVTGRVARAPIPSSHTCKRLKFFRIFYHSQVVFGHILTPSSLSRLVILLACLSVFLPEANVKSSGDVHVTINIFLLDDRSVLLKSSGFKCEKLVCDFRSMFCCLCAVAENSHRLTVTAYK